MAHRGRGLLLLGGVLVSRVLLAEGVEPHIGDVHGVVSVGGRVVGYGMEYRPAVFFIVHRIDVVSVHRFCLFEVRGAEDRSWRVVLGLPSGRDDGCAGLDGRSVRKGLAGQCFEVERTRFGGFEEIIACFGSDCSHGCDLNVYLFCVIRGPAGDARTRLGWALPPVCAANGMSEAGRTAEMPGRGLFFCRNVRVMVVLVPLKGKGL